MRKASSPNCSCRGPRRGTQAALRSGSVLWHCLSTGSPHCLVVVTVSTASYGVTITRPSKGECGSNYILQPVPGPHCGPPGASVVGRGGCGCCILRAVMSCVSETVPLTHTYTHPHAHTPHFHMLVRSHTHSYNHNSHTQILTRTHNLITHILMHSNTCSHMYTRSHTQNHPRPYTLPLTHILIHSLTH